MSCAGWSPIRRCLVHTAPIMRRTRPNVAGQLLAHRSYEQAGEILGTEGKSDILRGRKKQGKRSRNRKALVSGHRTRNLSSPGNHWSETCEREGRSTIKETKHTWERTSAHAGLQEPNSSQNNLHQIVILKLTSDNPF